MNLDVIKGTMMLRRNISRKEIACRCGCNLCKISPAILDAVQECRDYYGKPVVINSGTRCEDHNKAVGGLPNSMHLVSVKDKVSRAIDFYVEGVPMEELYIRLCQKYPDSMGIGLYKDFIHLDDRLDKSHLWNRVGDES